MLLNFEGGKYFTATMAKDKIQITRENGEIVDAQAPVIVSASRSTDIPAFYADWFLQMYKQYLMSQGR